MPKYEPFLGTTTDRNAAFAGIKSLSIKVVQDPHGMYCKEPWQRESTYSKTNIPQYECCRNPRCQQGGIDLQKIVWINGNGEHKFYCRGHEGSPKGRRKGSPCDNSFTVTVLIEKEQAIAVLGHALGRQLGDIGYARISTEDQNLDRLGGSLPNLAEFERELIRERAKAGMQAARRRARHGGRHGGSTPRSSTMHTP